MTSSLPRRPVWLKVLAVVAPITLAIGAWLGLRVSPADVNQGDLIRVMYAHVSVAWVSFLAVGVAALSGIAFLWTSRRRFDVVSVAASETALLFGTLTIIGGMTYSKPTLNTFWTWDAKLTLTALMVALLAGVFIVRGLIEEPTRRGRVSAVILIIVLASLPLNYLAAEWFRTLHPAKSIDLTGGGITMDTTMLQVLLFNVGAAALMYVWLLSERVRLGLREAEIEDHRGAGGDSPEVVRV